jgi:hypothetical protein
MDGKIITYSSHGFNTEDEHVLCHVSGVGQCIFLPELSEDRLQSSHVPMVVCEIPCLKVQLRFFCLTLNTVLSPSKNKCIHPHRTNHITVISSVAGKPEFILLTARYVNPKIVAQPATKEPRSESTVDSLARYPTILTSSG